MKLFVGKSVDAAAVTVANGVGDKTASPKHKLLDILRSAQLTGGFELAASVRLVCMLA